MYPCSSCDVINAVQHVGDAYPGGTYLGGTYLGGTYLGVFRRSLAVALPGRVTWISSCDLGQETTGTSGI